MSEEAARSGRKIALLGFCMPAVEAMEALGRPCVSVVPEGFEGHMREHDLPYVAWDFGRVNDKSHRLAKVLEDKGCDLALPLFEETVEWAGALNGHFRGDPRLFTRYLLFRDKAMMKRRAQMHGIRVGVFEEVDSRADTLRFLRRVHGTLLKIDGDGQDPVHLKPLSAAGCKGHRVLRTPEDVALIQDDEFPCLLETHLDGQEFSCEVFVHDRKIRFLNITEYVHLGYSNFVPASPALESRRDVITRAVMDLIEAFDIQYGMIHPEFFITRDDRVNFGEVAARVPGGHIFELIEKAYGFNPFAAFALCADPKSTEHELQAFFPEPSQHHGYAGCLMVYPKRPVVSKVKVPDGLLEEPYYEKHSLMVPLTTKVAERVAFGDHYGTVYFRGDDPGRMRSLLSHYEDVDFYVDGSEEEPRAGARGARDGLAAQS